MTNAIPTNMINMKAKMITSSQTGSRVHCDYVRQNLTSSIYRQQSSPPRQDDSVQLIMFAFIIYKSRFIDINDVKNNYLRIRFIY